MPEVSTSPVEAVRPPRRPPSSGPRARAGPATPSRTRERVAPRPLGRDAEGEIPRIPLQGERVVFAGAVVREKLCTAARHPPPATRHRRRTGPDVRCHCEPARGDVQAASRARAGRPRERRPGAGARPPCRSEPDGAVGPAGISHGRGVPDLMVERLHFLGAAVAVEADLTRTTMDP